MWRSFEHKFFNPPVLHVYNTQYTLQGNIIIFLKYYFNKNKNNNNNNIINTMPYMYEFVYLSAFHQANISTVSKKDQESELFSNRFNNKSSVSHKDEF